jgi:hypothetical protein
MSEQKEEPAIAGSPQEGIEDTLPAEFSFL